MLNIFTEHSDFAMDLNGNKDEISLFIFHLLSVFGKIDSEKNKLIITPYVKITEEHKKNISEFVNYYSKTIPKVNELKNRIISLPNETWIFLSLNKKFSYEESMLIFERIKLLNNGYSIDQINEISKKSVNKIKELFKNILSDYKIEVFNPERKKSYGNRDKKTRLCRFCNKQEKDGVTFKNEAHAISEALGNKRIITYEECDSCNSRLERTIETDLIEYLNIFRIFFETQGKTKNPKIKYKNDATVQNNGTFTIKSSEISINNPIHTINLQNFKKINTMDLYRCLCKFTVNLVNKDILPKLTNTIEWINKSSVNSSSGLPKVALLTNPNKIIEHPFLTIYSRDSSNFNYPHVISELHIWSFIFVFILPYSDADTIDFSIDENFDNFWNNFHFAKIKDWSFNNFNDDNDRDTIFNVVFKKQAD
ncbi:HNH endonuclease [Leptospira levettii]|uniref:HNH endonuclease 5 domain-containing protein n=1 Tax=Leptospira levettii TaxID=2023178 RepID=A0AAW5VIV4_9LEPT|nr:HNH endonuclease [Leptospira levettii]MCW7467812.1 hypothetical protein [Leptospira levettii]MCW7513444.1 hypothetical protein [Leptospira levettii]MCW7517206.1 hypothetical protein [Leptospira levettii]